MPTTSICIVFVYKLNYQQEYCRANLLKVNKNLKICYYYIIFIFGLCTSFRIESSRKLTLDFKKVKK